MPLIPSKYFPCFKQLHLIVLAVFWSSLQSSLEGESALRTVRWKARLVKMLLVLVHLLDPAPCDFWLFLKVRMSVNEVCYESLQATRAARTVWLKKSKEDSQDCFRKCVWSKGSILRKIKVSVSFTVIFFNLSISRVCQSSLIAVLACPPHSSRLQPILRMQQLNLIFLLKTHSVTSWVKTRLRPCTDTHGFAISHSLSFQWHLL